MDNMRTIEYIRVPEKLMKSSILPPAAKIVWVALLLDYRLNTGSISNKRKLALTMGLTRSSVYRALDELSDAGWYSREEHRIVWRYCGRTARLYPDLFLETGLSIQARLFHGLLQLSNSNTGNQLEFTFSSLGKEFGIDVKTVRKVIGELVKTGWISMLQGNIQSTITCTLRNPANEFFVTLEARIRQSLEIRDRVGEKLMKSFLSVLVASDEYIDNAKPEYLRSPETDYHLEFDRLYMNRIAFEFNGNQHYVPTEHYNGDIVEKQKRRDLIKRGICSEKNITLIIIHPDDLSLDGMIRKIGGHLPLRALWSAGPLLRYLEVCGDAYQRNTPLVDRS